MAEPASFAVSDQATPTHTASVFVCGREVFMTPENFARLEALALANEAQFTQRQAQGLSISYSTDLRIGEKRLTEASNAGRVAPVNGGVVYPIK